MTGRRVAALAAGVFLVACAAALVGTAVGPLEALAVVSGTADPLTAAIVGDVRLPRVLVGLAAGACLGLAGTVLQAVLRNPLASPEVTGVGSGAVLGAVAATLVGGAVATPAGVLGVALAGGVLGGGLLWLLAARAGADPLRLAVLGVLVSAVLGGGTLVLLTARPQLAGSMARWLVGSLAGRSWEHWAALWPPLLGCAVAGMLIAPVLGLLAVDDDHARGLGLAVAGWRSAALLVAVLATASAVASVGALAFVGLLAPHAARALVGADHRVLLPAAAVAGAGVVGAADAVAQLLTQLVIGLALDTGRQIGVPAGAVTAVAGAVVLIGIVRRRSREIVGEEA
jgi:iron complex transport system permease protein